MQRSRIFTLALASLFAAMSQAAIVKVKVLGTVDYCVISGGLATVPDGAPVSMEFNVDTDNFLNSANFPTRGYAIDLASFSMIVGGVSCPIVNPQTPQCWFVMRNNDPAVDGFFISKGGVELPFPMQIRIPSLAAIHDLDFSRTFNTSTTFNSLNILDALGFYDFSNMSSYLWTIGRFGNPGAEFVYASIELSLVQQNVPLTGSMTLADTGAFAANRTMSYAVKQGTTTVTSGSIVASSSTTPFSIDVPSAITGAATLEIDGSSFLKRVTNVNFTGASVNAGTVNVANGDVDNSGEVDAADIDLVIVDFGNTSVGVTDVDVSGEVDAADIDIVIANFGGTND